MKRSSIVNMHLNSTANDGSSSATLPKRVSIVKDSNVKKTVTTNFDAIRRMSSMKPQEKEDVSDMLSNIYTEARSEYNRRSTIMEQGGKVDHIQANIKYKLSISGTADEYEGQVAKRISQLGSQGAIKDVTKVVQKI